MDKPKTKVAITLGVDTLDQVRASVASGQARSVSAFIEHAVIGQLSAEADADDMIVQMLAPTHPPALGSELIELG